MTDRPVDSRIRDLLREAGGDRSRAARALARQAARDPALLAALAGPYLDGIAAHAVGRVAKGQGAREPAQKALTAEAMDAVVGRLGRRIGLSRSPEGLTALIDAPQPTRAGAQHEKTVRALAAVYARKRLDGA